jgi:hypothetical protein
MPAALHRREREAKPKRRLFSRKLLQCAEFVHLPVVAGQAVQRRAEDGFHLGHPCRVLGRRLLVDRFESTLFNGRELQQRQQRFFAPQLPADPAGNSAQPAAKGFVRLERVETAIGLEQSFDQDILGIFAVAAYAKHMAIDGIFVLVGQPFEVQWVTARALMVVSLIHMRSLIWTMVAWLCRMTVVCGSKVTGQAPRPWDRFR